MPVRTSNVISNTQIHIFTFSKTYLLKNSIIEYNIVIVSKSQLK